MIITPHKTQTKSEDVIDITPKKKSKKDNQSKESKTRSWSDVGDEFKNLLYDTFSGLRKDVNKDKEKKKK